MSRSAIDAVGRNLTRHEDHLAVGEGPHFCLRRCFDYPSRRSTASGSCSQGRPDRLLDPVVRLRRRHSRRLRGGESAVQGDNFSEIGDVTWTTGIGRGLKVTTEIERIGRQ